MTVPPEIQYFLGGLLGTAGRVIASTTQANRSTRSYVEIVVGGVAAMVLGLLGVMESLPLVGDDFAKLAPLTKSGVLFLLAYGGSHLYRAFEFRRNNGDEKKP
mgnify:CR=1 FL=1